MFKNIDFLKQFQRKIPRQISCGVVLSTIWITTLTMTVSLAQTAPSQIQLKPEVRHFRAFALQPKWHMSNYASPQAFRNWMQSQLEQIKPDLSSEHPNLVVLTELNGLPLILHDATLAQHAMQFSSALGLLLVKHLPETFQLSQDRGIGLVRALLLLQAPQVLETYANTCAQLALQYQVWLVCGSAPLPHLELAPQGGVQFAGTDIYNEALIFTPEGRLLGMADKVNLTSIEKEGGLDLTPGPVQDLRVFPTPVGDLGIATSLDAFKPEVIEQLERQEATVLIQPDANGTPWTGREQGMVTQRPQPQAWLESAWQAVQQSPTLRYGINAMVVGNLLDASFDGQSAIVAKEMNAQKMQSYVLTTPRAGFVKLMPWVESAGTPEQLAQIGRELAVYSGHTRENQYRSGYIWADLLLRGQTLQLQPKNLPETALQAYLDGASLYTATPAYWTRFWPYIWLLMLAVGIWLAQHVRRKWRVWGYLLAAFGVLGSLLILY